MNAERCEFKCSERSTSNFQLSTSNFQLRKWNFVWLAEAVGPLLQNIEAHATEIYFITSYFDRSPDRMLEVDAIPTGGGAAVAGGGPCSHRKR